MIPYRASTIKVLYIGLPKKEEGKVWWKYALIPINGRTKFVEADKLELAVKIFKACDGSREDAYSMIANILKVSVSEAKNLIAIARKLNML